MINKNSLLLKAVSIILRPLVKLLLAHQITYSDLVRLLKTLYVDVADHDFQLEDKPQTDSRISLLTGIHRKEVKNLRQQIALEKHSEDELLPGTEPQASTAVPAQIVAAWLSDSRCINEKGDPLVLPLYESDPLIVEQKGTRLSFEHLVQQISKGNLRVAPVLAECERLGLLQLKGDHQVALNASAFVPNEDFTSKAHFFAENMGAHMKTCCHNLVESPAQTIANQTVAKQTPLFDRSVSYNNLPADAIETLQEMLETDGMALLKHINRYSKNAQTSRDKNAEPTAHRMTVGLYFHTEAQQPIDAQKCIDDKARTERLPKEQDS